jgi:peptide-methionine (R)-S-oxide reductase
MQRRRFLIGLAAAPLLARAAPPAGMKGIEELQKNWKTFLPAGASVPSPTEPLKLSKDEWKKRLPPESYRVLSSRSTR